MMLTIYGLKNRLSGIFEKPVCELFDSKEYPEMLTQSLALAPVEVLERHREYDVYCLGCFESKTGKITAIEPEFLMSLEGICTQYIEHKNNVGRKEEQVASV